MLNQFIPLSIVGALVIFSAAATPKRPPSPLLPNGLPRQSEDKKTAAIGEKAPVFELQDQHGKTHKLVDYKGKVVVLEWFNDKCPICKNVWDSGLIDTLVTDLKNLCQNTSDSQLPSVVYLAMNSTANRPFEEVLKSGSEFIEEAEVEIPMLMDYDGKVGKSYGARTTPHMFILDTEGILVYQGALCDGPRNFEGKEAETHVIRVIRQLINGEEILPSYVQPWGCSVKYAKASQADGTKGPRRPRRPQRP